MTILLDDSNPIHKLESRVPCLLRLGEWNGDRTVIYLMHHSSYTTFPFTAHVKIMANSLQQHSSAVY